VLVMEMSMVWCGCQKGLRENRSKKRDIRVCVDLFKILSALQNSQVNVLIGLRGVRWC
jgi:hypothetical protein